MRDLLFVISKRRRAQWIRRIRNHIGKCLFTTMISLFPTVRESYLLWLFQVTVLEMPLLRAEYQPSVRAMHGLCLLLPLPLITLTVNPIVDFQASILHNFWSNLTPQLFPITKPPQTHGPPALKAYASWSTSAKPTLSEDGASVLFPKILSLEL